MKIGNVIILLILSVVLFETGCKSSTVQNEKKPLIIYHAGSLSVPFSIIETEFEEKYPQYDILRKSGGSRKMAKKISVEKHAVDVMASADYNVIDNLLIPKFSDYNIKFAANQLVLCYTKQNKKDINADNWYEVLLHEEIRWGHTDPDLDPCGYRSLMVMQLADKFYEKPQLYNKLLESRSEGTIYESAAQMVEELKDGKIDFAWEYLSVATQNNLEYITLPDEINLGNYKYDDYYQQAKVVVTGNGGNDQLTLTAKSITYGITVLNDAPEKEGAVLFLSFLLDRNKGLKILADSGQPPFLPPIIDSQDSYDLLPQEINNLVEIE